MTPAELDQAAGRTPRVDVWRRVRWVLLGLAFAVWMGGATWSSLDPQVGLSVGGRKRKARISNLWAVNREDPTAWLVKPVLDPWGKPFVRVPGPAGRFPGAPDGELFVEAVRVYSVGPDGVDDGGVGDDMPLLEPGEWTFRFRLYGLLVLLQEVALGWSMLAIVLPAFLAPPAGRWVVDLFGAGFVAGCLVGLPIGLSLSTKWDLFVPLVEDLPRILSVEVTTYASGVGVVLVHVAGLYQLRRRYAGTGQSWAQRVRRSAPVSGQGESPSS